ncbi:MAG: Lrp/AsnC family transcriptional regulator [Pseudomonadota bacterium]
MLDDDERRLLRALQNDPDLAVADLADRLGLTKAVAARRLDRLREAGILHGQTAEINWAALGYSVEVSLRVTLEKSAAGAFEAFVAAAREIPEVLEIQTFLGSVDVRLGVIARDMAHYQSIYRDAVLALPHIADIEALLQISEVYKSPRVPL